MNNKLVYVASVYGDKDYKLRVVLGNLLKYCNEHRVPLLIGMDSNAHSGIGGCADNNRKGEEVADLPHGLDLAVSKVGHTPTFRHAQADEQQDTMIDILVTPNNAAKF